MNKSAKSLQATAAAPSVFDSERNSLLPGFGDALFPAAAPELIVIPA